MPMNNHLTMLDYRDSMDYRNSLDENKNYLCKKTFRKEEYHARKIV